MKVSVVIPTCQNIYLHHTLKSLKDQKGLDENDYEVIVVENPELVDKNHKLVKSFGENFRYIVSEQEGSNLARNVGIQLARSSCIGITDDDVVVNDRWLQQIIGMHSLYPQVGIFGGPLYLQFRNKEDSTIKDPKYIQGWMRSLLSEVSFDVGHTMPIDIYQKAGFWLVSANLSFSKRMWSTVGGFKENIGYHGRKVYMSNDELEFIDACGNYGGPSVLYVQHFSAIHQIPPKRATIDYFEHKAYGQGYSDVEMWKRKNPGIDNLTLYNDHIQHKATMFMHNDSTEKARYKINNENETRKYINYYVRTKLAYMNGAINAIEGEIWNHA